MRYMFDWTFCLEHVYVGIGWNTNNVVNNKYMWSSSNISQVTTGQC